MELYARPHGAALVRPVGRALVGALAGGVCIWLGEREHWLLAVLGSMALGFSALLALATVWEWDRTAVVVTRDEVRVVHGLLRRRAAAVVLEPGEPVEVEQGIVGRLLGYGTLVAGGLEVPFVPVRHLS